MGNTRKILEGSPELRKRLPHGGVGWIAKKHGISWQWAYRVISGLDDGNQEIIADAMTMAEKYEKINPII